MTEEQPTDKKRARDVKAPCTIKQPGDKKKAKEMWSECVVKERGPVVYAAVTVICVESKCYVIGVKFTDKKALRLASYGGRYAAEFGHAMKALAPVGHTPEPRTYPVISSSSVPVPGISEWHDWASPELVMYIQASTEEWHYDCHKQSWMFKSRRFWIKAATAHEESEVKAMPSNLVPTLVKAWSPRGDYFIQRIRVMGPDLGAATVKPTDDWDVFTWADRVILSSEEAKAETEDR